MTKEYRIEGAKSDVDKFFGLTREFQNSTPLYTPIVSSSWPVAGNPEFGMCIGINDRLEFADQMAHTIAHACKVLLKPITVEDRKTWDCLRNYEILSSNARVALSYAPDLLTRLTSGAYHYKANGGPQVVIRKEMFDCVVRVLEALAK